MHGIGFLAGKLRSQALSILSRRTLKNSHLPLEGTKFGEPGEVALHSFQRLSNAARCSSIEFLEHHSTEPKRSIDREPPQRQDGTVSPTHSANVDRGIEQGSSHLAIQLAERL